VRFPVKKILLHLAALAAGAALVLALSSSSADRLSDVEAAIA
jgi:hypothetical protein